MNMTTPTADLSFQKLSRYTGILYLVIFITGIFANFFVLETLIAPGDASTTTNNLAESEGLFRIGILGFIIMVVADVLVSWALYVLLKPVNQSLSLLAAWLRLVNSAIFGIALYHLFTVLQLVSDSGYTDAFEPSQVHAQVMLALHHFDVTWLIGLIFFGLHLVFLGQLILKSGYIPKFIGVLLLIAAVGYLIDSFTHLLLPNYADFEMIFMLIVLLPGIVGELSLTLWLLIKGVPGIGKVTEST